jgi:hypothetical protein
MKLIRSIFFSMCLYTAFLFAGADILFGQSLFSLDKDTTQIKFRLPESMISDPLNVPSWQLKPDRYPHLRSPAIQDPRTMLLNWENRLDFLKQRRVDPRAEVLAETNRRFMEFLERERYARMPALDKLRIKLKSFAPVLDAIATLASIQMGALRAYTYGADFELKIVPRSFYSSESMEERFQRNAYQNPEAMALYKQFLWMEQNAWTRPASAMPATE